VSINRGIGNQKGFGKLHESYPKEP